MRLLGVLEVVALDLFVVRHAEGVVVGQGEHQAEGGALHGLAGDLWGVGEGAEGLAAAQEAIDGKSRSVSRSTVPAEQPCFPPSPTLR